jgi:hypothetical protein
MYKILETGAKHESSGFSKEALPELQDYPSQGSGAGYLY